MTKTAPAHLQIKTDFSRFCSDLSDIFADFDRFSDDTREEIAALIFGMGDGDIVCRLDGETVVVGLADAFHFRLKAAVL